MRLSPPPSLRLNRSRLLADLVDRVARTRPEIAAALGDPTDPGWLLIEQAAWMVERLSEQLDALPPSLMQRMGALLGASLQPAHPAIGVAVVWPREGGTLTWGPDRPAPWRLFTAQTETRGLLEFAFFERGAPVRPATVASWTAVRGGELLGVQTTGAGGALRPGPLQPTGALSGARVRFRLATPNPDALLANLAAAVASLLARRIGWLGLEARTLSASEVCVEAWVELSGVFRRTAPGGFSAGGDLEGDLSALDTSPWTPSVRLAALAGLPTFRHGAVPLPGRVEGTVLVPDLPPDLPVARLLEARAWPLPASVAAAIWTSLAHSDAALSGLRPTVEPVLPTSEDPREPTWLQAVLRADAWSRVVAREGRQLLHVALEGASATPLRVVLVASPGAADPLPEAWALGQGSIGSEPLAVREAWRIALPSPVHTGMETLIAWDLAVPGDADGVLLAVDAPVAAALLNATLVINAPPVADGRALTLRRAVPEAVTLLSEDLVDPTSLDRLLDHPLSAPVRQHLRRLPLACFPVSEGGPIRDLAGVGVDGSAGELLFGAPDARGVLREVPVGATISLDWYRRTDGAHGEVEAGALQFVEQPPRTVPALDAVSNPFATFYGQARETEEACRARLFGPTDPSPVLSTDWERAIRAELGTRGQGWEVRCWGHAEHALLSHAIWPLDPEDSTAAALRQELETAGPDVLLVALGPMSGDLPEPALAWARERVAALIGRTWERRPMIREAIVTRLWPLSLQGGPQEAPPLPCHHPDAMGHGVLRDGLGRRHRVPRARLLLNAAVVALATEEAP